MHTQIGVSQANILTRKNNDAVYDHVTLLYSSFAKTLYMIGAMKAELYRCWFVLECFGFIVGVTSMI